MPTGSEVPPLVSALGALLGMVGLLGVAYAVFTSAKVQKTVELYKLENEAQGKRIGTLEAEKVTQGERLAAVERENITLKDLATGKSFLEGLSREMQAAENQRMIEHQAMISALAEVKDSLAELWRGVARMLGGQT